MTARPRALRAKVDEDGNAVRKSVVMLTNRGFAKRAYEQFLAEDYDVFVLSDGDSTLPQLSDPNSISKLKRILANLDLQGRPRSVLLFPYYTDWGYRPELPQIARELELVSLTPSPKSLSFFTDQLNLLSHAAKFNIPNLLLGEQPIQNKSDCLKLLASGSSDSNFPIVLKSVYRIPRQSFIYVIRNREQLERDFPRILEELRIQFGETIMFAERCLDEGRLIQVPFYHQGRDQITFFPEVDLSLQVNGRRMIEVCPAHDLADSVRERLHHACRMIAQDFDSLGLGDFEFLVDGDRVYFVGGGLGLDYVSPIVEEVVGASLSSVLLHGIDESVARGNGTRAVQCNIYAEDPVIQVPRPGCLEIVANTQQTETPFVNQKHLFRYEEGECVDVNSDGWVGSFVVSQKRPDGIFETMAKLIEGSFLAGTLETNENFLYDVLTHPWVRNGMFHASFLENEFIPALDYPNEVYESCFLALKHAFPKEFETVEYIQVGEKVFGFQKFKRKLKFTDVVIHADKRVQCRIQGEDYTWRMFARSSIQDVWHIRLGHFSFAARALRKSEQSVKPVQKVYAQCRGLVRSVFFQENDVIEAHETILNVLSLRNLVHHSLPKRCLLKKIFVKPETEVDYGEVLCEIQIV